ncbi:efflux RND transporter permease subunit [Phenylobacterium immobile]|uniref:efflux RND transporter permease subunit n=1 Tax=Phenylobacterium immobile TaxID=21 RepID=UPI000ABBE855|nr:efflux RND transporter permease subunit [Phenylobacterium immobile]
MTLSDLSVRRPVFAAVAAIILCVIGAAAFMVLPVRELPNIDPPSVSVSTTYRGASAEVVEERITEVIERQVSGIQGIDRVNSSSRDGTSRINVAFTLDRNLDEAANDVRDAVSRVTSRLPIEADPPQIAKADADAQPIMILQLSSTTLNRLQLTDYANRYLVERLSTVPGVAQVNVAGALNYAMRVWLDPEAMAARGVTVQDVQTALTTQNLELPAGSLEAKDKDFTVRVARGYSRPDQFALMPIALPNRVNTQVSAALGTAGAGAAAGALPQVQSSTNNADYIVRLGDIARIEEGADEPRRLFRANGMNQVGLAIQRQSQANDLQIATDVNNTVAEIIPTLPKGMKLVAGVDNTEFTREALHEVWITMGISLGLVALVNILFLGSWRAALIPTIVAPICILSTFIVLATLGFSLNLLTLLALVLAIGLVVDDAIVVVENIQRRIDDGEPPLLGAERGARQVFFAVVATTAVLMAVFAPLMFMPGYIGRLFVELAVAVAGAVFFSALMALSLSPMLASKLLRPATGGGWLARNVDRAVDAVRRSYERSLQDMLGHRATAVITSLLVVALMGCAGLIYMKLPKELVPLEDRGRVDFNFQAPEGSGFDYTTRAVLEVERRAKALYDKGEISRYFFSQPSFGQNQFNTGGGNVELPHDSKVKSQELAAQLNRDFADITSARVIASVRPSIQRGGGPGGGANLDLIVLGNEYPQIEAKIKPLLAAAEDNPGMARARLAYEPTSPRVLVSMDRDKAAALGVSANAVGQALQTLFGSAQVTTYIKNGQEYDVILQTDRAERQSEGDLKRVYVRSASGIAVPLSSLVTTQVTGDTANRPRVDRMRSITLSVQLNPGYSVGEAVDFFKAEIAKQPTSVSFKWGGLARDFLEGSGSVGVAFGVALLLVFLVLAAQFESWIHPAVIMLTVPVAALGGLFGLLLAGSTMNTYSQIGLIILVGVAAKNGILIVEFANQLRDEGRSIREAVIESATLRLRPIVMTSISAAAGAIPLILWGGAGGESRKTIGVTIFFGAIFATLVTLFIVPVFYNLLARFTKSPEANARQLEAYERDERYIEGHPAE